MGTLDKRDYELCTQALELTSAANAKAERLKKLAAMTLDQELRRLLEPVINVYADYPGPSGSHKDWLVMLKPVKADLLRYVNYMLRDDRPQWQVIAEQNGWGPNPEWKEGAEKEFLALRQEVANLRRRIATIQQETAAPLQAKIEALQAVIAEQDEILNQSYEKNG